MNYLKIQNNGELDIRLISLMGGTTKANDEFKIGQFGTGLKYFMSWCARNNVDLAIFIGNRLVEISTKTEKISNNNFEVIYIDGERTSITSGMGLEWSAWMIIREIYCNALDEGGDKVEMSNQLQGKDGCTTFYIQMNTEIQEVWDNWSSYFLHGQEPIWSNERFAIYEPSKKACIYKNGVLIKRYESKQSIFSYDFKNAHINELRQYVGYLDYNFGDLLKSLDKETALMFLERINEVKELGKYFEGMVNFDYFNLNDEWGKAIGSRKVVSPDDLKATKEKGIKLDMTDVLTVPPSMIGPITQVVPEASELHSSGSINGFYRSKKIFEMPCIAAALHSLKENGYTLSERLNIVYGEFIDNDIYMDVNSSKKELLIDVGIQQLSGEKICEHLVMNNELFRTGDSNGTISFERHLVKLLVSKLLPKAILEY